MDLELGPINIPGFSIYLFANVRTPLYHLDPAWTPTGPIASEKLGPVRLFTGM
jgi:hypothetical protein